jgi:quercetin dioxygenase-like cupin family protein
MTTEAVISTVHLRASVDELHRSAEWASEPRASRSLLHAPGLRIVLAALHAGADLRNEDPDEAVAIQGLQGSALIAVDGVGATLDVGDLIAIPAGARWRLVASTEAVILLTVAPSTMAGRDANDGTTPG